MTIHHCHVVSVRVALFAVEVDRDLVFRSHLAAALPKYVAVDLSDIKSHGSSVRCVLQN